jgi:23S rRNA pseudouridine2605 synthase
MRERLFTVGRLDVESEGLILLTNDGELAHRLAHPRFGVQKIYHVMVAGVPTREELEPLTKGVRLADGWVHAERATVKSEHKQSATLEIVLREGKNREIRRLLARIGHKVMKLKRVSIGGVKVKDLEPGQWRRLSSDEVNWLREAGRGERRESGAEREGRPPRRDGARPAGRPPRRLDGEQAARAARPPRSREYEQGDRPARPPRANVRPPRDGARPPRDGARPPLGGAKPPRDADRPPRRPPLGPPPTTGPVGMMADEPGTIKPLPRARKPGKRHKRRVKIGATLRKNRGG